MNRMIVPCQMSKDVWQGIFLFHRKECPMTKMLRVGCALRARGKRLLMQTHFGVGICYGKFITSKEKRSKAMRITLKDGSVKE